MVHENIIFGIDIAKGSLHAREKPGYAVVILKNGDAEHHKIVASTNSCVWYGKKNLR